MNLMNSIQFIKQYFEHRSQTIVYRFKFNFKFLELTKGHTHTHFKRFKIFSESLIKIRAFQIYFKVHLTILFIQFQKLILSFQQIV